MVSSLYSTHPHITSNHCGIARKGAGWKPRKRPAKRRYRWYAVSEHTLGKKVK
nr:MAG TPA: hypothetical protein [Crassvirales sp.]